MSSDDDQERFDETGEQPNWQSKNPHVPKSYRLDLEYNCYTNNENAAKLNPNLIVVYGWCRLKGDTSKDAWGNHCWCKTKTGEIVDPYFEWKFPGQKLIYSESKKRPSRPKRKTKI